MVVERLQVERAVDVQTAVAADGVAKTGTVVEFRSPYPRVMGVIRGIGIDPVEDGQFIQWQLVGGCHLLLVVERSAEVTDALLHRVFPRTILIGVEILVDGRIGLLDLGTGSTLKVEVQIPREVPSEGEVAVPEELLGEDQWQVLTLQIFQVALLQFTVVTRQLTIEGNALRQVVETQRLGEVQPLRLTLELFEGLPSLIHGRVAIVEGSTPLVLTIVDGGLALGTPMGVTIREREVGGVVGHGVTLGFQTPTHVGKGEVAILRLRDGNRLDTVALVLVGGGIEGIVQSHVGIQRIIAWTGLLLRHRVVEGDAHLCLVREELAEFE